MSDTVLAYPDLDRPTVFTQDEIGWVPWLEPLPAEDLTDRHWAGLVDAARAKSPYFMLLVRDPEILEVRTKTDKDIFYNPEGGLPRAERELSALAASRFNGCIFCASVHARFAAHHSKRSADVQRVLDEGVGAEVDALWDAVIAASVALTATPMTFGPELVRETAGAALPIPPELRLEVAIAAGERIDSARLATIAEPVALTCPGCGGVLSKMREPGPLRFRCQVGHGYAADVLAKEKESRIDEALRVALRIVEERPSRARPPAHERPVDYGWTSEDLPELDAFAVGQTFAEDGRDSTPAYSFEHAGEDEHLVSLT